MLVERFAEQDRHEILQDIDIVREALVELRNNVAKSVWSEFVGESLNFSRDALSALGRSDPKSCFTPCVPEMDVSRGKVMDGGVSSRTETRTVRRQEARQGSVCLQACVRQERAGLLPRGTRRAHPAHTDASWSLRN